MHELLTEYGEICAYFSKASEQSKSTGPFWLTIKLLASNCHIFLLLMVLGLSCSFTKVDIFSSWLLTFLESLPSKLLSKGHKAWQILDRSPYFSKKALCFTDLEIDKIKAWGHLSSNKNVVNPFSNMKILSRVSGKGMASLYFKSYFIVNKTGSFHDYMVTIYPSCIRNQTRQPKCCSFVIFHLLYYFYGNVQLSSIE